MVKHSFTAKSPLVVVVIAVIAFCWLPLFDAIGFSPGRKRCAEEKDHEKSDQAVTTHLFIGESAEEQSGSSFSVAETQTESDFSVAEPHIKKRIVYALTPMVPDDLEQLEEQLDEDEFDEDEFDEDEFDEEEFAFDDEEFDEEELEEEELEEEELEEEELEEEELEEEELEEEERDASRTLFHRFVNECLGMSDSPFLKRRIVRRIVRHYDQNNVFFLYVYGKTDYDESGEYNKNDYFAVVVAKDVFYMELPQSLQDSFGKYLLKVKTSGNSYIGPIERGTKDTGRKMFYRYQFSLVAHPTLDQQSCLSILKESYPEDWPSVLYDQMDSIAQSASKSGKHERLDDVNPLVDWTNFFLFQSHDSVMPCEHLFLNSLGALQEYIHKELLAKDSDKEASS